MIFCVVKHLNFNVFILLNVYRVKLYLVFNFWWTIANVKFLNLVVNSLRYDINSVHRVNASPIIVLSNVEVSSPLTSTAKQRKSLTLPYMRFESNRTTKAIFLSLLIVIRQHLFAAIERNFFIRIRNILLSTIVDLLFHLCVFVRLVCVVAVVSVLRPRKRCVVLRHPNKCPRQSTHKKRLCWSRKVSSIFLFDVDLSWLRELCMAEKSEEICVWKKWMALIVEE